MNELNSNIWCNKKDFCIYVQEQKNQILSTEIETIKNNLMKIIDFIESNNQHNLSNIDTLNDILELEDNSFEIMKTKLKSIYNVISKQNNESIFLKSDLEKNYENILLENEKLKIDEESGFYNIAYLYNYLDNIENLSKKNIFIIELKDFSNIKKTFHEKDIENILKIFLLLIDRNFKNIKDIIFRIDNEKVLIIYNSKTIDIENKLIKLEESLWQKIYQTKYSEENNNFKFKFNKYYINTEKKSPDKIKKEINSRIL